MEWLNSNLLTVLVFLPVTAGALSLLVPDRKGSSFFKGWALFVTFVTFVLSLKLLGVFSSGEPGFFFVEKSPWIEDFGVSYHVGIDSIAGILIVLTTFLMPLTILSGFGSVHHREKEYYFLLLFLHTGMLGAFVALDVFLFYLFWEAMLIPMYFLIGIWGGKDRIFATVKFFIYTLSGSLLMLVAMIYMIAQYKAQFGEYSASLLDLYRLNLSNEGGYFSVQGLLFLAFAIAFSIKVPLFPLHTWLPDAHVQAPTAGSVILAGVLLKLGGYGFLRFAFPLFPQAVVQYQPIFLGLGSVAIVYGAAVALVQTDVKKLVAYSSVSHMGYVIVGLFALTPIGITGSIFQMVSHGISTGALFLMVGMIYDRRHTREMSDFGGIAKVMPVFTVFLMVVTLSSVALPGTNGFVGEFLILLGTWEASRLAAVVAGTGVILGAVYMLYMFQKVMFGPLTKEENRGLKDLSVREWFVITPFAILIFVLGFYPTPVLKSFEVPVQSVLSRVKPLTMTGTAVPEAIESEK